MARFRTVLLLLLVLLSQNPAAARVTMVLQSPGAAAVVEDTALPCHGKALADDVATVDLVSTMPSCGAGGDCSGCAAACAAMPGLPAVGPVRVGGNQVLEPRRWQAGALPAAQQTAPLRPPITRLL